MCGESGIPYIMTSTCPVWFKSNHFVQINTNRPVWSGKISIVTCYDNTLHCPVTWHQPIRGQWWDVVTNQSLVSGMSPVSVQSPLSHSTYQVYMSPCHHHQAANQRPVLRCSDQSEPSIPPPCLECHVSVSFHKCMCLTKLAYYCQY